MRYMLMMHAPRGTGDWARHAMVARRPQGSHRVHAGFQRRAGQGGRARRRRRTRPAGRGASRSRRQERRAAVTDGPFAEAKEFLAGYWIVEVIAPSARTRSRRKRRRRREGRRAAEHGDRGASGDERAARRRLTATRPDPTIEHLLRDLAPQVLGVVARRHARFRGRGGRGAGSADRRGDAVAARRAFPRTRAAGCIHVALRRAHRSRAQRDRASPPRGRSRERRCGRMRRSCRRRRRTMRRERRRHARCCCSCAATRRSRRRRAIALTLRAVGGLTTAEIARAFLVPEATMAQRISRAKQSIKASGVPFELPTDAERAERLARGAARALSHLQRGLRVSERRDAPAHRSLERSDPARAAASRIYFPATARSRDCSRSCC